MMSPTTSPKTTQHRNSKRSVYITQTPVALILSTAVVAGLSVGYVFYVRTANARQGSGEITVHLPDAKLITGGRPDGVAEPPPTPTPRAVEAELPEIVDEGDDGTRKMMRESYLKALRAPTGITTGNAAASYRAAVKPISTKEDDEELDEKGDRALLANLRDAEGEGQPNSRQKFLDKKRATTYLSSTRMPPLSRFELKAGSVIPGVMLSGINSDLPGQIQAQVAQDVYDTKDGNYLLIPRGSRLVGEYDNQVIFGQRRVLVKWDRCVFPDASTLELEAMQGADSGGYAGFHDRVNNHFLKMFGAAAVMSVISAGYQVSQPDRSLGGLTAQDQLAASMGRDMSQFSIELIRRNLDIQPTLQIRPGYRFHILVNKDVILPGAFKREE